MSDRPLNTPHPVQMSSDDVRATLIFLSVAKSTYEFIGRLMGDGEERFAHQRLAIESLSMQFRSMLVAAAQAQAAREIPAETIDRGTAEPDIVAKVTAPNDKRAVRRRRK